MTNELSVIEMLQNKGITYTPTPEQLAIYQWVLAGSGNLIIRAVAGSGKTSVLIASAKLIPNNASAAFIAFSKTIVDELRVRLSGTPVNPTTIHSAGRSSLAKRIRITGSPDGNKYRNLAKSLIARQGYKWADVADLYPYTAAVSKLAEKGRLTMVDFTNANALVHLAILFGIDLPKITERDRDGNEHTIVDPRTLALMPEVISSGALDARETGRIDFTDMIWLPVLWKLAPDPVDWLMIDECQDWSNLSRAFLAMMITPSTRVIAVGDNRQSVMGFAGAASDSFEAIKAVLNADELPLYYCFRCGSAFIDMAQRYVPHITAAPGAIQGEIVYATSDKLTSLAKYGDLIVSRKTAPLIASCIKLIGMGIAARVRGKDVAGSLVELTQKIGKMRGFKMIDFLEFMRGYREKMAEMYAKEENADELIDALNDRIAAIRACYERYEPPTLDAFKDDIENLFAADEARPPIWLSSIHRAKGLESDRVVIIDFDGLPMAWKNQTPEQALQEENLTYVALTRAKKELVLLVAKPPVEPKEDQIDATPAPLAIEATTPAPAAIVTPDPVDTRLNQYHYELLGLVYQWQMIMPMPYGMNSDELVFQTPDTAKGGMFDLFRWGYVTIAVTAGTRYNASLTPKGKALYEKHVTPVR